jgi:drug/metabolite transporter (DMT)-like permease
MHLKGILITLLGVVLMSVESPLIKYSQLDTYFISFVFGLCLFISVNVYLLFQKTPLITHYTQDFQGVILSSFFMGISNFLFIASVEKVGIAKTVLILASSPLVSALFAFLFLKQHTPKRIFIATLFVFIGLYIILRSDIRNAAFISNLYAFGCVMSFSIMFVILSKHTQTSRFAYVSLGGFFLTLFSLLHVSFSFSFPQLIPILVMGIFVTPVSRVMIGTGTRYLIPSEIGLLMIAESILAPIWGWLWLDEAIGFNTFLGGGIILASLLINSIISIQNSNVKKPLKK